MTATVRRRGSYFEEGLEICRKILEEEGGKVEKKKGKVKDKNERE